MGNQYWSTTYLWSMDIEEVSEHGEVAGDPPVGWKGGELAHTGGNLFAREWVHPEKELRIGYSVDDPSVVGVEKVSYEGSGDKANPQMWVHVSDLESEPCDNEGDCLETAMRLMREVNGGD